MEISEAIVMAVIVSIGFALLWHSVNVFVNQCAYEEIRENLIRYCNALEPRGYTLGYLRQTRSKHDTDMYLVGKNVDIVVKPFKMLSIIEGVLLNKLSHYDLVSMSREESGS